MTGRETRRRFPLRVGLAFLGGLALAGVVAGVVLVSGGGSNRARERSIDSVSPRAPDELPAEELAEQGEQTQERLEALEQARTQGTLGLVGASCGQGGSGMARRACLAFEDGRLGARELQGAPAPPASTC